MPYPKKKIVGKKHPDRLTPTQFREAVWIRDRGIDRATGRPLFKVTEDYAQLGQVCHLRGRNVMPEWATDPVRAILLSAEMHILSDARGGYRLKIIDAETNERAEDATRLLRFTLYSRHGDILWTRTS